MLLRSTRLFTSNTDNCSSCSNGSRSWSHSSRSYRSGHLSHSLVVVCHAHSSTSRPPQRPLTPSRLTQPPSRPQQPQQPQQPQHLQQQTAQELLRGPSSPAGTTSSNSNRVSRLSGRQPGQVLLRPQWGLQPGQGQQQQEQPQQAVRRRVQLNDADARMAAFDQLVLQVTFPGSRRCPEPGTSFNKGACQVRNVTKAALQACKVERPTPVQGHVVPAIRGGHDVLVAAPPGAGSSMAALIGVLAEVLGVPRSVPPNKAWPLALVLCPTRELAQQLAAHAMQLVAGTHLGVKCVTGGTPIAEQVLDLRHSAVDLLVATPGRLVDLLANKRVSLARVKYLVMEEVDELMGPALAPLTKQLLHHRTMTSQNLHQAIALGSSALPQQQLASAAADVLKPSAVVVRAVWQQQQPQPQPQPQQLQQQSQMQQQQGQPQQQLASLLADPAAALAAAAAAAAAAIPPFVGQRFLGVAPQLKARTLQRLLATTSGGLTLVFTNSAAAADEVCGQLNNAGMSAGVLHYGRSQAQREEALQCFRYGVTQMLVVCGSAYRGLDLPDVALVVNYEVPLSLAEYARRVGRAGREGKPGSASTLITPLDSTKVAPLVALLKAGGQPVPEWLAALADGTSPAAGGSSNVNSAGSSADAVEAVAAGSGSGAVAAGASSPLFRSLKKQQFGAYDRRRQQQQPRAAGSEAESTP